MRRALLTASLTLCLSLVAGCSATDASLDPELANVSQAVEVSETYRASSDYSSVQGYRGWHYLSGTGVSLTYNANGHWQGNEQYLLVYRDGAHPGENASAVRKWVSPRPGRVRIQGGASDAHTTCGDGVTVSIRMGHLRAPALWSRSIPNGQTSPSTFDLNVDVLTGTSLFFVVEKNGNNHCDSTWFDPTLTLTYDTGAEGSTYSAQSDFVTPGGNHLQGHRGWTYETITGAPLQWDGSNWRGEEPYQLVYASGQHPGSWESVRKWTSPTTGLATISFTLSDGSWGCGDGASARIERVSRTGAEVIWQASVRDQEGAGTYEVKTQVGRGTALRFIVDKINPECGSFVYCNNYCDWTTFDPTITISASPDGRTFVTDAAWQISIDPPAGNKFEVPFVIAPGGWRLMQVTTGWTDLCSTEQNPLAQHVGLSNCTRAINIDVNKDWARNYYGSYSQLLVGDKLLAFNHGENKNEGSGDSCRQNTINTDVPCKTCSLSTSSECWASYNGFIGLSWQYDDLAHNWGMDSHVDDGPILWPTTGYLSGGRKATEGLRHPHAIAAGDHLYVFYQEVEHGDFGVPHQRGIRVARSPASDQGRPGSWKTWCNGSWVDSLPRGFDRNRIREFYEVPGGCSTALPLLSGEVVSFAVAASTRGGFLGVSEHLIGSKWEVHLYSSPNLVDWTFVTTLRQLEGGWDRGDLHYPVFLSADGWRSDRVDENAFYVIGTDTDKNRVSALPVSLSGRGGTVAYVASSTESATRLGRTQKLFLQAGERLTLGVCGQAAAFSGDTYLRLYSPSDDEVASNDDACALGSQLSYTVPLTGTYTLRMGCYRSDGCTGTVVWDVQ